MNGEHLFGSTVKHRAPRQRPWLTTFQPATVTGTVPAQETRATTRLCQRSGANAARTRLGSGHPHPELAVLAGLTTARHHRHAFSPPTVTLTRGQSSSSPLQSLPAAVC